MASEIVVHTTLPALESQRDKSTNLSKSLTGRQFATNTVISAWVSISVVDSIICEDVVASTLSTLMVKKSATLIELSTKSPHLID